MTDAREQQFLDVLKHFPDDATTLFGLASHYRAQDRLDDAMRRFRECIEHDPAYGAAYLSLGEILEDKGELEEARKVLETAVKEAEAKGDIEIVNIAGERLKDLGHS